MCLGELGSPVTILVDSEIRDAIHARLYSKAQCTTLALIICRRPLYENIFVTPLGCGYPHMEDDRVVDVLVSVTELLSC